MGPVLLEQSSEEQLCATGFRGSQAKFLCNSLALLDPLEGNNQIPNILDPNKSAFQKGPESRDVCSFSRGLRKELVLTGFIEPTTPQPYTPRPPNKDQIRLN